MNPEARAKINKTLDAALAEVISRGPMRINDLVASVIERLGSEWADLRDALATERLAILAGSKVSVKSRANPAQLTLSFPGFEHVPLMVRSGKAWITTLSAGIPDIEDRIASLKRRLKPGAVSASVAARRKDETARTRKELAEYRMMLRAMRYFAKRDDPEITAERALYRLPEFETLQEKRRAAISARWDSRKISKKRV